MKKKLSDKDLKKVDGGSVAITAFSQTLGNKGEGNHTISTSKKGNISTAKPYKVTVTKKTTSKKKK